MEKSRTKGFVVSAAMLLTGLVYLLLASRVPGAGGVDASFFPAMIATGMILLGAIHLFQSWCQPRVQPPAPSSSDVVEQARARSDDEDALVAQGPPNYRCVVLSLLLITLFVLLLQAIGFVFAAAAYLVLQFALLSPSGRPIPWCRLALLALVVSTVIFFLFRYGFSLLLPAGLLTPWLP